MQSCSFHRLPSCQHLFFDIKKKMVEWSASVQFEDITRFLLCDEFLKISDWLSCRVHVG